MLFFTAHQFNLPCDKVSFFPSSSVLSRMYLPMAEFTNWISSKGRALGAGLEVPDSGGPQGQGRNNYEGTMATYSFQMKHFVWILLHVSGPENLC